MEEFHTEAGDNDYDLLRSEILHYRLKLLPTDRKSSRSLESSHLFRGLPHNERLSLVYLFAILTLQLEWI